MKFIFENADVGLIGLLFFFLIFTGIAIWAYTPSNRARLEAHKSIPLRDDDSEFGDAS